MKTYKILTVLLAVLFAALFLRAQTRDRTVTTTATADLKATSLRITVSEFTLDRVLTLNVELNNTNTTDRIIDRRLVRLAPRDVKDWGNSTTNDQWLEAFVLEKVALNRR